MEATGASMLGHSFEPVRCKEIAREAWEEFDRESIAPPEAGSTGGAVALATAAGATAACLGWLLSRN